MTAQGLLSALFNAAVAVSILATVLSLGLSFTLTEVLAPLRRVWLVLGMVVLNCVVIPAAAWGLFAVMGLPDAAVAGLALTTAGAAGSLGLKASQLSRRAALPLAVSLVVALQLVNLVSVPLWAGRIVSGASISPWAILEDLLGLVLLPLVLGIAVRGRYPEPARRWQPGLVQTANLALGAAVVAGLSVNWSTIMSLAGTRVIAAALLVPVLAIGAGFMMGRDAPTRTTTGIVSGVRFTSLGLIIIGTQLGGASAYLGPALVLALADLVVALVVSLEIGRRAARAQASPASPSLRSTP